MAFLPPRDFSDVDNITFLDVGTEYFSIPIALNVFPAFIDNNSGGKTLLISLFIQNKKVGVKPPPR